MSKTRNDYYVYVYIDPRNYEEFYYGKGRGNRKIAHEKDKSDSDKAQRIKDIHKDECRPIIRVIARDLSEAEALLIETTLIWKLGRSLLNIASGRFSKKFRPRNKIHLPLSGFDFRHGIYYVNIGEGPNRCWEDCRQFGFVAAGQGTKWSSQLQRLNPEDIVVAYVKHVSGYGPRGYVGIGKVTSAAERVLDFRANGRRLEKNKLKEPNIFVNSHNDKSEFLVGVHWVETTPRDNPKWQPNAQLFTPVGKIVASLEKQTRTIRFVENNFNILLSEV